MRMGVRREELHFPGVRRGCCEKRMRGGVRAHDDSGHCPGNKFTSIHCLNCTAGHANPHGLERVHRMRGP